LTSDLGTLCTALVHPPPLLPRVQEEAVASEYSTAFNQLVFVSQPDRNVLAALGDPKLYLAQALGRVSMAFPGLVGTLVAGTPVAATVGAYMATAGVVLS